MDEMNKGPETGEQIAPAGEPGRELETNQEARTMAMLANILAIFTGFIGPLVIYFIKGNENKFVKFHSLQCLYFELIGLVVGTITCGLGFIALIVFNILIGLKANNGEWAEYPLVAKWVKL